MTHLTPTMTHLIHTMSHGVDRVGHDRVGPPTPTMVRIGWVTIGVRVGWTMAHSTPNMIQPILTMSHGGHRMGHNRGGTLYTYYDPPYPHQGSWWGWVHYDGVVRVGNDPSYMFHGGDSLGHDGAGGRVGHG